MKFQRSEERGKCKKKKFDSGESVIFTHVLVVEGVRAAMQCLGKKEKTISDDVHQ